MLVTMSLAAQQTGDKLTSMMVIVPIGQLLMVTKLVLEAPQQTTMLNIIV